MSNDDGDISVICMKSTCTLFTRGTVCFENGQISAQHAYPCAIGYTNNKGAVDREFMH